MTLDQQLRQAASEGNLNTVNEALTEGADVNARGDFGDTALNLAAEYGHDHIVERLLEAGADIENLGGADKTPLMNAAFAGQVKVVELLLSQGARINRDLLSSMQMKVSILEENAEAGMVNPAAAEAWRGFLGFMVERWQEQNPSGSE
ncbi:MAG: ankyrin repeat domain-containing protein [Rhodothermales bacterium]